MRISNIVKAIIPKYHILYTFLLIVFMTVFLISCRKELLNEKPQASLTIPSTLKDFQGMLDYMQIINLSSPALGETSSDDFYLEDGVYNSLSPQTRNAYNWSEDIFEGRGNVADWNGSYQQIFYANIILDQLIGLEETEFNSIEYRRIKGAALFLRSNTFYDILQVFAMPYDKSTANIDLGIPLKLNSDVNQKPSRSTVQKCYDQIITDLLEAAELMDNNVDFDHPNRSSKPAVLALLSRVYLTLRDYERAGYYASECLKMYHKIADFNLINITSTRPFGITSDGVIYLNIISTVGLFNAALNRAIIDSTLYSSYEENDLRKYILFTVVNNRPYRKSSYGGRGAYCSGLTIEEILLNRAECYARAGKYDLAMKDLNSLLIKRYVTNEFVDLTASSASEALEIILKERRKELVFRGIRWSDIRRLNKEGANITLRRIIGGVEYTLPPNDKRYALPIPPDEILLNPMPQNER